MKNLRTLFFIILFFPVFTSFIYKIGKEPELAEFTSSECQDDIYFKNISKLLNRIKSYKVEDDVHVYKIFVVTNCSGASKGAIEVKNDTLNLKYSGTPYTRKREVFDEKSGLTEVIEETIIEVADCDCAFELTYKIQGLENKNYMVMANEKLITKTKHKYRVRSVKPKFDVVDNDTINIVDVYGLKQGLHVFSRNKGKFYSRIKYHDDEKVSGVFVRIYDNRDFDKEETFMENEKYTKRKYYKNNKLIKVCDTDGTFDEGTNCKYFD